MYCSDEDKITTCNGLQWLAMAVCLCFLGGRQLDGGSSVQFPINLDVIPDVVCAENACRSKLMLMQAA